jgi:hypothetical protein
VTFAGLMGELRLDDPAAFFGHVVGFSAPSPNGDFIDLAGLDFGAPNFAASFSSGVLTVTDGTHGASSPSTTSTTFSISPAMARAAPW